MNHQHGITLIITVLMMTIMLSIVMGVSSILLRQVKLISNVGNAIIAKAAADTGLEKTLYLEKFQAGRGGLCTICSVCSADQCKDCQVVQNQTGCQVSYNSSVDGVAYQVRATIISGKTTITSQGFYRQSMRQSQIIK